MPVINGQGYNIGTDLSVVVSDDQGDVFPLEALGHVMDFESEADDSELKIVPISNGGKPLFQTIWVGGHGTIMFSRVNGNLQKMTLELMAAYHQAGLIPIFSLSTNILNRDGSVDGYLYTGVQFSKPKFGGYRALKEVDQNLSFSWSDCVATGGAAPFLAGLAAA